MFLEFIEFRRVLLLVSAVILASTVFLTGFLGLLVLATSSFIGYSASLKSQRQVLVSVLLVPSILYFAGHGFFI